MELFFRTNSPDGLIFMNARLKDASSDQLTIGLHGGKLKIVFVLDGVSVTTLSQHLYDDGKQHKLVVSRYVFVCVTEQHCVSIFFTRLWSVRKPLLFDTQNPGI